MDKIKLKEELIKFAEFCKKNGGTSWNEIPESAINSYINKISVEKCIYCANNWLHVGEKEPPIDIEVLAKSPDGIIHLTTWRQSYNIFDCQCKSESSDDWLWKYI